MTQAHPTVNPRPRIVFAGTPDFAVPSLEALAAATSLCELVTVYTQPDRRAGRGRRLQPSAVKRCTLELGVPVAQPPTLRDEAAIGALRALRPELFVVAAYGLLLPRAVLDIPRLGCVNVHASLLPRWRGAAPVQHAILAGDTVTGVTLMQIDAGLDTGAMLAKREVAIGAGETGGELTGRLARLGAELLSDSLPALLAGNLEATPQDDSQATRAPKIHKRDAEIDWRLGAAEIARRVRAFDPWPIAQTRWAGRQLRIWRARVAEGPVEVAPGTVVATGAGAIEVATGAGLLLIDELQPAGKRRMTARDFLNAHDLAGAVLGEPAD